MEGVLKEIDSRKKEMVKLLSMFVKENTVNPPGNENRVARIIEKELKKEKINYSKITCNGRPNIIATIGNGKPSLFIEAHMDTVPVCSLAVIE